MTLDKEQAQGVIDDFVFSNDKDLHRIAGENKALFNATINALDFLSKKFGTGEKISTDRVLQISETTNDEELPFKVGDRFNISKTTLNFTIEHISNTDVGLIYDDGLTGFVPISSFSNGLNSGYYKPIQKSNIPQKAISIDVEVGDLILDKSLDKIFEVAAINKSIKQVQFKKNASGTKVTPFDVFNVFVGNGVFIKLPFKIGDSFETPTHEIKEIIGFDGILLTVTTNFGVPKAVLYDVIKDRIDSGEWTKLSFTQPKTVQNKAPQVVMASNSAPIWTKPAKKTLSKEEKAIKVLQKEIDGLELIADFDDEAKSELEKKLIEIKALKSKIS